MNSGLTSSPKSEGSCLKIHQELEHGEGELQLIPPKLRLIPGMQLVRMSVENETFQAALWSVHLSIPVLRGVYLCPSLIRGSPR